MFKILILAYLIGFNPVETQYTFEMQGGFKTMKECKTHLLAQHPDQTYEVMREFVTDLEFHWDWLAAGCKNDETGEIYIIEPTYPKGKPDELQGIKLDIRELEA